MAVKSSYRQKRLTVALLVGALILVAVVLHAPVTDWLEGRRICEQLRAGEGEGDEQFFNFTDTTRRRFGPQLSPGTYRLTLTSDCYSGECSFVVPDVPKPSLNRPQYSGIQCRGQELALFVGSGGSRSRADSRLTG